MFGGASWGEGIWSGEVRPPRGATGRPFSFPAAIFMLVLCAFFYCLLFRSFPSCCCLALKMFYVVCDLSNLLCTCSGGVGGVEVGGSPTDLLCGFILLYIVYVFV